MEDTSRRLREQIQHHRSEGPRPQFPASLRQEIIAYASKQRASGQGVHAIGRALGLNANTLYVWLAKESRPAELRRVEVVSSGRRPAGPVRATLVTPRGLRVEGLGVQDLVAVLRALA